VFKGLKMIHTHSLLDWVTLQSCKWIPYFRNMCCLYL